MQKKYIFIISILNLFLVANVFADRLIYSDEPLENNIIMDSAKLVVDFVYFNNYLVENYKNIGDDQINGIREHSFLLIDSIIKNAYSEDQREFHESEKTQLSLLYNWGSRLGLYGCDYVADYFNTGDNEITNSKELGSSFNLDFNFPIYSLTTNKNYWTINYPYYFMISKADKIMANYGVEMDFIKLSTLFGQHKEGNGESQSTILFTYSYTDEIKIVKDYWINVFGLSEDDFIENELIENSFSYYKLDNKMHKELFFMQNQNGIFMITFIGIDGTYQSNRVHFLDFIKNLEY